MSDRERWIVYPLLFFAILMGARDRIMPPNPLQCQRLECRSLVMRSQTGAALVELYPAEGGALLTMSSYEEEAGSEGEPVSLKRSALRGTLHIGASEAGGYVTMYGPKGAPALKLGHHPEKKASGLIGTTQGGDAIGNAEAWSLLAWEEEEAEDVGDGEEDADSTGDAEESAESEGEDAGGGTEVSESAEE